MTLPVTTEVLYGISIITFVLSCEVTTKITFNLRIFKINETTNDFSQHREVSSIYPKGLSLECWPVAQIQNQNIGLEIG